MGTKVWILRKEFLSKNLKFFFGGEAADLASLARAVPKPLAIDHPSLTVRVDSLLSGREE